MWSILSARAGVPLRPVDGRRTGPGVRRAVASAVAVALLVAGCSGGGSGSGGATAATAGGDPVAGRTLYEGSSRHAAPALTGKTIAGPAYDSAHTAGKVAVVNFWASWCIPCKAETAGLVQVAGRNPGVAFVGVDEDHGSRAPATAFAKSERVTYPSLWDKDTGISARWAVPDLPFTFVLDRHGRIAARWIGKVTPAALTPVLDRLQRETA